MTNDQLEQIREALEAKRRRALKRAAYCVETEVDLRAAEYNDGLATAYGIALRLLNVGEVSNV
jgi:hypothetical protein